MILFIQIKTNKNKEAGHIFLERQGEGVSKCPGVQSEVALRIVSTRGFRIVRWERASAGEGLTAGNANGEGEHRSPLRHITHSVAYKAVTSFTKQGVIEKHFFSVKHSSISDTSVVPKSFKSQDSCLSRCHHASACFSMLGYTEERLSDSQKTKKNISPQ